RGVDHDFDRRRAEVVHPGNLHPAVAPGALDAGKQRHVEPVADLDGVDAEGQNFVHQRFAIGVPAAVPAGGERKHGSGHRYPCAGGAKGEMCEGGGEPGGCAGGAGVLPVGMPDSSTATAAPPTRKVSPGCLMLIVVAVWLVVLAAWMV